MRAAGGAAVVAASAAWVMTREPVDDNKVRRCDRSRMNARRSRHVVIRVDCSPWYHHHHHHCYYYSYHW